MHHPRDITALDAPAPDGAAVPVVRVAGEVVEGAAAPLVDARFAPPDADAAPLPVVPEGTVVPVRSHWRALLATTAIVSVMLHGAVVAAFMTMATTPPQRTDMPAVEVEMVEAEAEPPPAAAAAASEANPVEMPQEKAARETAQETLRSHPGPWRKPRSRRRRWRRSRLPRT